MRKFRLGLKYVFTTKRFKQSVKKTGCFPKTDWYKKCNGREVNVTSQLDGKVGMFSVHPNWCKVVK
ncbi:hypothetical protein DWZ20_13235 [Clostridium perfringens]|uniref:hypothetical protein n=1 Tax=Clostridium perfringens TaxID=1502 RepID=UPI000E520E75|nr:hypothetical protein [Clostridium perfringens]RHN23796.1 hypothetical protein DWZ20_13235 [Clostridium perfringens]